MSSDAHQKVIGFNISVDKVLVVNVFNSAYHLWGDTGVSVWEGGEREMCECVGGRRETRV